MPNWCQNKIQICCDQANAEQLKSRLFAQDEKGEWYLDFELLVPMNVCANTLEVIFHDCGDIDCFFDTPWGPPDSWFDTLCKTFPDIEFTLSFFESRMRLAGEYVANLDGSHYEVTIDDSEIREFTEDVFGEEFYDEDDELA